MSYLDKIKDKIAATLDYKSKLAEYILTNEEKSKRIDICNSCEFLFTPTRSCKKCGCFVDGKAALAKSECPMTKWPKIIVNKD
jgi:predicted Zn-ribbon and HTH transcriptional regulator